MPMVILVLAALFSVVDVSSKAMAEWLLTMPADLLAPLVWLLAAGAIGVLVDGVTPRNAANLPHKSGTDTITGQWGFEKGVSTPGGYNFVRNADFERWTNGPSGAGVTPDEWTLNGSLAAVARDATNFKIGTAAAALTRTGTDCYLSQRIDQGPVNFWASSKSVVAGAWVRATVASRARLIIDDGVGTTASAYHSGGSAYEFLTVARTLDAGATKVELKLQVDTGNTTAQFDAVWFSFGSVISDWAPAPARVGRETAVPYNYVFNGGLEIWGAGAAVAPTGWTVNGAGATVARSATRKIGTYSASLTRAGADCQLYQSIDLIPDFGPVARWQGVTVTVGAWVKNNFTNTTAVRISDGVTEALSSLHSGNDAWAWLTATMRISATATNVTISLAISTNDCTASIDGASLVIGSWLPENVPSGWQGRKCALAFGSDAVQNQSTTEFLGVGTKSATEVQVTQRAPFRCVARNLHVNLDAAPAAGQTAIITFRTGEATDTAIAATVTDAGRTASDVADEVAMTQGTLFSLKSVLSATSGNRYVHGTIELEEVPAGI